MIVFFIYNWQNQFSWHIFDQNTKSFYPSYNPAWWSLKKNSMNCNLRVLMVKKDWEVSSFSSHRSYSRQKEIINNGVSFRQKRKVCLLVLSFKNSFWETKINLFLIPHKNKELKNFRIYKMAYLWMKKKARIRPSRIIYYIPFIF
jgi:hypothetical protein